MFKTEVLPKKAGSYIEKKVKAAIFKFERTLPMDLIYELVLEVTACSICFNQPWKAKIPAAVSLN